MEKQPTIYFAHPPCTYGTTAEIKGLLYLSKLHPQHRIINPAKLGELNAEKIQHKLASSADMLVYIPYADGKIDAAIGAEIKRALRNKQEVHEMHVNIEGVPIPMVSNITKANTERVLTPEESSARVATEISVLSFKR